MKLLIVEDDLIIREMLAETIRKWGFEVTAAERFDDILSLFINESPQLVLLDINLPAYDGYYWCEKIRELSKVPVIFISSRDTPMDMIMAMNMGGDDFVQKPFDTNVLMAKINALLRRSYSYVDVQQNVLEHDSVFLNLKDWEVSCGDKQANLTKTEFIILQVLMQQTGTIVSRQKIMRSLWKDESFVDNNTLTVNITRLRKKLTELGKEEFIMTKKGEGYIIS